MTVNLFDDLAKLLKEEREKKAIENQMLDKISHFVESLQVVKKEELVEKKQDEEFEVLLEVEDVKLRIEDIVNQVKEQAIKEIKEQSLDLFGTSPSAKTEDPLTPFDQKFATKEDLQKHYTQFLTRIQQQLASIGGGGEVKFRYLDDVNRHTMTESNNNWVLEYDTATGKAQFTNQIGPIDYVKFDLNHTHEEERIPGTLCWSQEDLTLNLQHPNNVTQQVGQVLYGYVRNQTGNTIPQGAVVGFAGAEQNGTARLLISPYTANGVTSSLYILGVATENIEDGLDGHVTVWGKVRDLNMSAFNVGDILYANPTVAGGFTNIKPTAPNNVIPIAAVLNNSNTAGEIFVRPTIEQKQPYGSFVDTNNHTANTANTAYAIPLNKTEFSSGISRDSLDNTKIVVQQSGLYNFQFSTQFVSTNAAAKDIYIWARKNGIDIPDSASRVSVVGNDVYFIASWNFVISLNANDYFQLMWATTDTSVSIIAPAATAFAPAIPSTILTVTLVAQ